MAAHMCSALLCSPQGVEFKLEIKNLALSDSKGHDLEKEIVVRVTALERKQVAPSLFLSPLLSCELFRLQFCLLSVLPPPGVDVVQGQVCEP